MIVGMRFLKLGLLSIEVLINPDRLGSNKHLVTKIYGCCLLSKETKLSLTLIRAEGKQSGRAVNNLVLLGKNLVSQCITSVDHHR